MPRRKVDEWFWQIGPDLLRLTEELGLPRPMVANRQAWEPRVDVTEDEASVLLKVELAGVSPEDVELLFAPDRGVLMLRGQRLPRQYQDGQIATHQLEILYGPFEREIHLPAVEIDPRGIRATFRNGFLYVELPKRGSEVVVTTVVVEEV